MILNSMFFFIVNNPWDALTLNVKGSATAGHATVRQTPTLTHIHEMN